MIVIVVIILSVLVVKILKWNSMENIPKRMATIKDPYEMTSLYMENNVITIFLAVLVLFQSFHHLDLAAADNH